MQFRITSSKAVPSKTTMSILECILVNASENEIKLTANDMDLGIETCIEGDIIEKGIIALDAKIFLDMGFYIGVGGVMTFKNSKIDEVIKEIPLDRLLLETDAPFLTPEPFRKYSNEPKYIRTIGEYLANLKGVSLDEVSTQTEENIKNIFDI